MSSSPLASTSIKRHYARGAVGLLALVAAVAGAAVVTPVALALLIVTVAAWRGCPSCWAVGLMQTRDRYDRSCDCKTASLSSSSRAAQSGQASSASR